MAPIALKDKRIEELTKQLVKRFVSGELSRKNVPVAVQFALSNFRYHKFLDVDSNKVERTLKGLHEKFSIHGQEQKAKSLTMLSERFLDSLLFDKQHLPKSDVHYSVLKVLITLSNSPVNAIYNQNLTKEEKAAADDFNWTKYLLDGEEKYTIRYDRHDEEYWTDSDEEDIETEDEGLEAKEDKNLIQEKNSHDDESGTHRGSSRDVSMLCNFLTECVTESYWLPDEGCPAPGPESMPEMSLAIQWETYSQECHPFSVAGTTQRLHEIHLVRETIWMLSGVKQLYVYTFVNEKFGIRSGIELTHITKVSLYRFLETFADTATTIVEIRKFINSVNERRDQMKIPLTFQAFSFAVLEYLKEFNTCLSETEELIIKKEEAVTLSMLKYRITQYQKEIAEIYSIYLNGIKSVTEQENYAKVACFLNAFNQKILLADGLGEYGRWKVDVLLPIFLKSLGPYIDFLDGCLTEGKLVNDTTEFCIERLPNVAYQSPEIWKSGVKIRDEVMDGNSSCPSFLAPVLPEVVLAGKSMILLETLGELAKNADIRLQEDSLYTMFTNSVSGLTNMQSMVELFRPCLYPHIQAKYEKACSSLISLLKSEYMLLEHLAAVRNFFFLEAGDAMHHFYTDIFKKCSLRERWQDMSYLNSLFQEALLPGYSNLQDRFTVGYSKPTEVSSNSFEGLELNYKAPWPVNLVIDADSQKKYNDVFLFLLHVKRAKWSLDDLRFKDLKDDVIIPEQNNKNEDIQGKKNPSDFHLFHHRMHLVRFDLMQFVNGLHQYIMTRILHSKLEFEEALAKATDLGEIIKAHSLYIEKVLERCLMTNKLQVMEAGILKVLKLAVKFNKLWTCNVGQNRGDIVVTIGDDLKKWRTFIVNFLTKQIELGSKPHLEALAYSLGSKKTISEHES